VWTANSISLFSNLQISSTSNGGWSITFNVQNTGSVTADDVPQLYCECVMCVCVHARNSRLRAHTVSYPKSAGEPEWQLRDFVRVRALPPQATQSVRLGLSQRDTSVFDATSMSWQKVSGTFGVAIAKSVIDFELTSTFTQ
jgi:hypothetical protein